VRTPHEASQSGQDGGHESNTSTPCRGHSGGGGADLHNGSTVEDGRLIKVHIVNGGASSKMELIPESHGGMQLVSNEALLFRILSKSVRQAFNFFTA